jgi:hypothetical protein
MAPKEIELDVAGKNVTVPHDVVSALAAAAAARAGVSSRHRDLSLLLGRALGAGKATLSRGEARALDAVLEESGLELLSLPQQDGAGRGADAGGD